MSPIEAKAAVNLGIMSRPKIRSGDRSRPQDLSVKAFGMPIVGNGK